MMTPRTFNARILVIDDEESVRDGFCTILAPKPAEDAAMQSAADVLFGDAPARPPNPAAIRFEVDVAANGRDGLWMVESAVAASKPYAAIFCDIRMPGWDGLETVERIRAVDRRAQVVFVTAYSDHSIETVVERAGADVGYFVKPFITDEVKQLATKLTLEWNKARDLEELVRTVTTLRGETRDVERLVQHLLEQICMWLDTESAALLRIGSGAGQRFVVGVGTLQDPQAVDRVLAHTGRKPVPGQLQQLPDGTTFLPLGEFGLVIALPGRIKLTPDRRFLLQVFTEHSALAIHNSEMRAQLQARECMAAVGEALAYILHDIRGPIGTAQMLLTSLRRGYVPENAVETALARIDGYLRRAIGMVGDSLAFSRGGASVSPADVDLGELVAREQETWRAELDPRGVALAIDVPPGLHAHVDEAQLERILWNLIKNAAAATAETSGARVEVGAAARGDGVELWVADNGPGLPDAIGASLFDPFGGAARPQGTGFGLAIVKQLVEAHRGTIHCEREADLTRFRLSFPGAARAAA
jgi:signal transduction histidine kinase